VKSPLFEFVKNSAFGLWSSLLHWLTQNDSRRTKKIQRWGKKIVHVLVATGCVGFYAIAIYRAQQDLK